MLQIGTSGWHGKVAEAIRFSMAVSADWAASTTIFSTCESSYPHYKLSLACILVHLRLMWYYWYILVARRWQSQRSIVSCKVMYQPSERWKDRILEMLKRWSQFVHPSCLSFSRSNVIRCFLMDILARTSQWCQRLWCNYIE